MNKEEFERLVKSMRKEEIKILLSNEYKKQVKRLELVIDDIRLYTKPEEGRIEVAAQVDASIWKMGAVITTNCHFDMGELVKNLSIEDYTLYEEVETDILSKMMKDKLEKSFYILYMTLAELDF